MDYIYVNFNVSYFNMRNFFLSYLLLSKKVLNHFNCIWLQT